MPESDIAVIGMACRFPGAADVEEFWGNLVGGVDSVTRGTRRTAAGGGDYVPARGVVPDVDLFDAGYFGYTPRDARIISPQHRVMLECAVHALEHAGHDPARTPATVGVYAGGSETCYAERLRARRGDLPAMTDWEIRMGSAPDYLASRVAYKLDLDGPAVTVQAACATSLFAVHTAIRGLLAGDCDMALAGGISVDVPGKESPYVEGGILSADGVCRAFDAAAAGTVGSDGVGLLVLRRLADALADGDHVYAVLRGSAVGNDGAEKVGFTAPGVAGQAAVVRRARRAAGVADREIGYVEAHGTATPLGDMIELAALGRATEGTAPDGGCAIGSVKTNIGHADAASGAAGLIKTVLAVARGVIPASLHFTEPNPRIGLDDSPFRVATATEDWQEPRTAGVSSFGMGGANAHVVVGQAPEPDPASSPGGEQLVVLSARSPEALDAATERLAGHVRTHPEQSVADIAWTLQVGRKEHPWRRYAVVASREELLVVLEDRTRMVTVQASTAPSAAPTTLPEDVTSLGELWGSGVPIDWEAVHGGGRRRRLALPGYPFERQRYLVEPAAERVRESGATPEEATPAALAQLLAETLELPEVAADDDFFDLGGDSLVAVSLIADIRTRFGTDLDLDAVLETPTATGIAGLIEATPALSRR